MIADDARRELHRRAALYLCGQAYGEDEEIASHFERGGEPAHASERYAAAALAAAPRGDTPTVLRCSERALAMGVRREVLFALHMARADTLRFLGKREDQSKELALSRDYASNDAELARVLTERAVMMMRTGKRRDAIAEAEAAVGAAERAGDPEVLTAARARHVGALIYGGELQQARQAFEQAMLLADAATARTRAFLADVRAQLAAALGDLGERQVAFQQAAALYREAGDIRRTAGTEANLADLYNRVGAYAEAEQALRQAIDGGRRVNNRFTEGYGLLNLGYALLMQGKVEDALEALRAALVIARATADVRLSVWARIYVCMCRLRAGDVGDVPRLAQQLAAEAAANGERGTGVVALTVAASAQLASGDPGGALVTSTRALATLEELDGIEEGEAEVFVTHARALEAVGRRSDALLVLQRGRERIDHIAERISDPQWRTQYLQAVAAHRELTAGIGATDS
jgi:tetratricopeptide (TPR) repeat protein